MNKTFDNVLPELVRICESHGEFDKIEHIVVVRDLKGCVRLVICPVDQETIDTHSLTTAIASELGGYFKQPIFLTTSDRPDERRLATELVDRAAAWTPPDYENPITGGKIAANDHRWKKIERRLSKQEWINTDSTSAKPPWELESGKPAIVTFYSFKGGVGRTTALVSVAWQFATVGKRVCIVDLDLEAPGLGTLLGAESQRGVLDFLIDVIATGKADLSDCHAPAATMEDEAGNVDVIPAGQINLLYMEKLSRLDFVGTQTFDNHQSPVQKALTLLLKKIKGELRPDFILLDSRAGLHDIAGLSLHGLAHVDVIIGRAAEQSYEGMNLTLHALGRRKDVEQLMTVMVHAFAPHDEESPEGMAERKMFRDRLYSMFSEHIYSQTDEDVPQVEDTLAAHTPIVLSSNQYLERFSMIAAPNTKRALLEGLDYKALAHRVEELCNTSVSEDDES
jgi:MinD-like ATPase involved in chromosome partitioning or flagellar assembly